MLKKEYNVKSFFEYPLMRGYDQYASTVLGMNGITEENIKQILPDQFIRPTIENYFNYYEPLQYSQEFVSYIQKNKDKFFFVIGDYDCDGIFATVIISQALRLCGCKVSFTAPDRFTDGYGMKKAHIDEAIKQKANIIITVDNGTTAINEIKYAHDKGLKVIVTDHHNPQGDSGADLIINPWVNSEKFKDISGATVAFKLAVELQKVFKFDSEYIYNFMALAAITCFSDVMSLTGENRLLVLAAMNYLNEKVYESGFIHNLAVMLEYYVPGRKSDPELNLPGTFRDFNKDNIDFYFVPVINASNRVIGNVNELILNIIKCFDSEYNEDPHQYTDINQQRKYMKSDLLRQHKENKNTCAVVEAYNLKTYDINYNGIVGLVASSITETEHKPALIGMLSDDDIVHFSGRSVHGFNLYEALEHIQAVHPNLKFTFGGHAEALGMSCKKEDISVIQNYLSDTFKNAHVDNTVETYFDANNHFADIVDTYYHFYPYGKDFVFPKLYTKGIVGQVFDRERSFTILSFDPSVHIKTFSKEEYESIKLSHKALSLVLELSLNKNGYAYCKLNKQI